MATDPERKKKTTVPKERKTSQNKMEFELGYKDNQEHSLNQLFTKLAVNSCVQTMKTTKRIDQEIKFSTIETFPGEGDL